MLDGVMPALIAGTAPRIKQDLTRGSYFGGRKPADGKIDWRLPAKRIHDLVRGVAPPYPGAFTAIDGRTLRILRTRMAGVRHAAGVPRIIVEGNSCYAICGDGQSLEILALDADGKPLTPADFSARFGAEHKLDTSPQ